MASLTDGECQSIARPYRWLVNIGSGNGLVPSGNKPLPEPMLTQTYVITKPQETTQHVCVYFVFHGLVPFTP